MIINRHSARKTVTRNSKNSGHSPDFYQKATNRPPLLLLSHAAFYMGTFYSLEVKRIIFHWKVNRLKIVANFWKVRGDAACYFSIGACLRDVLKTLTNASLEHRENFRGQMGACSTFKRSVLKAIFCTFVRVWKTETSSSFFQSFRPGPTAPHWRAAPRAATWMKEFHWSTKNQ